jgi:hypothetical protein
VALPPPARNANCHIVSVAIGNMRALRCAADRRSESALRKA